MRQTRDARRLRGPHVHEPALVLCDRLANRARLKLLEGWIVMVFEHWCECTALILRKAALDHRLSGGVPPMSERCVFEGDTAFGS
jgi:hypothetical protein